MSYGIIYLLTSPSGKYYVGQTIQKLNERWHCHKADAKRHRTMECRAINNAIRKYDPDSFEKQILSVAESKESLDNLENVWIILLQSDNREYGYNLRTGGSARGKHSEETKRLIGKAISGEKNGFYGKHHTEETKQKISEANARNKFLLSEIRRLWWKNKKEKEGLNAGS